MVILSHGDRLHAGPRLNRRAVAQGRVQALPIIKHLDVLEHRGPRLGARAEPSLMDPLCFERGKEALHGRIIETVAPPAHRWLDAMPLQHRPIRPSGILGGFKWSSQHGLYELIGGTGPEPRPVFSSPGSFAACC